MSTGTDPDPRGHRPMVPPSPSPTVSLRPSPPASPTRPWLIPVAIAGGIAALGVGIMVVVALVVYAVVFRETQGATPPKAQPSVVATTAPAPEPSTAQPIDRFCSKEGAEVDDLPYGGGCRAIYPVDSNRPCAVSPGGPSRVNMVHFAPVTGTGNVSGSLEICNPPPVGSSVQIVPMDEYAPQVDPEKMKTSANLTIKEEGGVVQTRGYTFFLPQAKFYGVIVGGRVNDMPYVFWYDEYVDHFHGTGD